MDDADLIAAAREAQDSAYAPYSEYVVGAALLTDEGTVFTGCNVEVANYSNSLHAEEVALGSAVRAGHREFVRIAVSSGARDGQTPCGMCRQTLAEFCGSEFEVLVDRGGRIDGHDGDGGRNDRRDDPDEQGRDAADDHDRPDRGGKRSDDTEELTVGRYTLGELLPDAISGADLGVE